MPCGLITALRLRIVHWSCLDVIVETPIQPAYGTSLPAQSVAGGNKRSSLSDVNVDRREHITPLLRQLHWLRVPDRITF